VTGPPASRPFAQVHAHQDGQARPGGDLAPGAGDIDADRPIMLRVRWLPAHLRQQTGDLVSVYDG
jgi:hypothetical protein